MFDHLPDYQPALPSLWQGRTDTLQAERFFQKITFIDQESDLVAKTKKTIFLGFSSDAGILRNMGRAGAKLGPDQIKTQLAKLPCSNNLEYVDLGNITCNGNELESAQDQFAQLIHFCHQHGHQTIAFGGGHEISWAHYQGLTQHYPKLGIINFDAHFDIRPFQTQQGNSGTSFSQIAHYCKEQKMDFDYCCLGIQKSGNTSSLFERAKQLNIRYLSSEQMNKKSMAWQIKFIDEFMLHVDHIYLTLCLDVLAECYAPGVSAPQPMGLTPWQILPLLKYILHSGKVVSLDIAELSPPLDKEEKTARLAALIIAELLHTPI